MNAIFCDNYYLTGATTLEYPDPSLRGRFSMNYLISLENQPLPTDPVGTMSLTLTNLVVGSIYDVEVLSTGALITTGSVTQSSTLITVPVYLAGDPKNSLRIKVRKGSSSPYYQPYETQALASIGSASIFVNQLSDES